MSKDFTFPNEFAEIVFKKKYKGEHGAIEDLYIHGVSAINDAVHRRYEVLGKTPSEEVAASIDNMTGMLLGGRFVFGGRIMAAFGNPSRKISYYNCTNINILHDSIEGIFDAMYRVARVSSRGQGVGIDFSALRPRGASVNNAAYSSTGSVSYMELFDRLGTTIAQDGDGSAPARRMAMLFTLRCDHPDVIEFIHCKREKGMITNANISVLVSEKFISAVENGLDWNLEFDGTVYRSLPARELWNMLVESNMVSAEPGVLFLENAKKTALPEMLGFPIVGYNACTEASLDYAGVCNLGSLNLGKYIVGGTVDYQLLAKDIKSAVLALDAIIDLEFYENRVPIQEQADSQSMLRRIGLGVMGVADMLALLGIDYGSDESKYTVFEIMRFITNTAYSMSAKLAKEIGMAPALSLSDISMENVIDHEFIARLDEEVKESILRNGLRNTAIMSVAPTGSISNLVGCSSGIEPLYRKKYTRMSLLTGEYVDYEYIHPAFEEYPDASWIEADEVNPMDKLEVVALAQYWVDQSISNTGNFPSGTTNEDISNYYYHAFKNGAKGLTVYVDNAQTQETRGAVLKDIDNKDEESVLAYQGSACLVDLTTGEYKCD